MSTALHDRPGVVVAGLAFLAALVGPFRGWLRGDLDGLLGVVPPLVAELLVPVVAPGVAVLAGARIARAGNRTPIRSLAGRAGGGALAGATLGFSLGVLLGGSLFMDTGLLGSPLSRLFRLSATSYLLNVLPVAVAAVAGLLAGVVWTRRDESGESSLGRDGVVFAAVVGGCALVAGFAVVVGRLTTLLLADWTLVPPAGYTLLGQVGAPLAAAVAGVLVAPRIDRPLVRAVGAVSVGATAVGMAVGYAFVRANSRRDVGRLVWTVLDGLVLDGMVVAAVLVLAAVAGVAVTRTPRTSPGPASG